MLTVARVFYLLALLAFVLAAIGVGGPAFVPVGLACLAAGLAVG